MSGRKAKTRLIFIYLPSFSFQIPKVIENHMLDVLSRRKMESVCFWKNTKERLSLRIKAIPRG